ADFHGTGRNARWWTARGDLLEQSRRDDDLAGQRRSAAEQSGSARARREQLWSNAAPHRDRDHIGLRVAVGFPGDGLVLGAVDSCEGVAIGPAEGRWQSEALPESRDRSSARTIYLPDAGREEWGREIFRRGDRGRRIERGRVGGKRTLPGK